MGHNWKCLERGKRNYTHTCALFSTRKIYNNKFSTQNRPIFHQKAQFWHTNVCVQSEIFPNDWNFPPQARLVCWWQISCLSTQWYLDLYGSGWIFSWILLDFFLILHSDDQNGKVFDNWICAEVVRHLPLQCTPFVALAQYINISHNISFCNCISVCGIWIFVC